MAEKKKFNLEEGLDRLEALVDRLEDEKLSLEESVKVYEEAVKLAAKCNSELEGAKRKVRLLQKKDGEAVETEIDEKDLK